MNLSPFSHSLSISSSFSHSLSIFSEPGCQDATIFATLVYAKRLFSKIKTTFIYSRGCAAYKCIGTIKLLHFPLSVFSSSNKKERCCSLWSSRSVCWTILNVYNVVFSLLACGDADFTQPLIANVELHCSICLSYFLSPSGDLGISLVWHNLSWPPLFGPTVEILFKVK